MASRSTRDTVVLVRPEAGRRRGDSDVDLLVVVFDDDDDEFERRVLRRLDTAINLLRRIVSDQAAIDAAVAQLGINDQALADAAVRIQSAIADLQAQDVDTSQLEQAIADANAAVGNVVNIVPPPADEPPVEPPADNGGTGEPPV